MYRERYFATSSGTGPGATGYYLTNVVFVKKWLKQAHSALAVRALGTADQEVARSQMLADFRSERPEAFGSSWETPVAYQVTASPAASLPSAASSQVDRVEESPSCPQNLKKRRIDIPGPPGATERIPPLVSTQPPRGALSRGCKTCKAAFSDVFHPGHSKVPGKRYCPSSGVGYVEWLRRCGLPLAEASDVAAEEASLETRRRSWGSAKPRAANARLSKQKVDAVAPPTSNDREKSDISIETADNPAPEPVRARSAEAPSSGPPPTAPQGGARASNYSCGRCNRSFEDWYHPTHRASGKGFYCPLTDGPSFGQWVNLRLLSIGKPALNAEELDAGCRERENSHKRPAVNAKESCSDCRAPLARTFHAGCPQAPGWRHCPERDGDYADSALAEIRRRGEVPEESYPSLDSLRKYRAVREARWAARHARAGPSDA